MANAGGLLLLAAGAAWALSRRKEEPTAPSAPSDVPLKKGAPTFGNAPPKREPTPMPQAPGAAAKVAMPPAPSPSELQVAVEREIERRKAAAEEEAAQRKKAAQQAEIERRKTEPKKAKLDRLLAQRSEMVQAGKKAMTDPDTGEHLTLEELHTRIGQLGSW